MERIKKTMSRVEVIEIIRNNPNLEDLIENICESYTDNEPDYFQLFFVLKELVKQANIQALSEARDRMQFQIDSL